MKNSFVQSMAWLHTWAGLVVGWLLFAIFVGGTLACFDKEIDDWMRPALHGVQVPDRPVFDRAIALSRERAPDAHAWYVTAGNDRERAMESYVYYDDGSHTRQALDPTTGGPVPDTAGGDFFFTLHYNLHAGTVGMYVVGFAGMLMLVALVAGIVIHKRIFKDFFTFRPKQGGQRAWLDGHNVTGVLGLPFHLMIAYTGVAIFVANYMFAGINAAYDGDVLKFYEEAGDLYERPEVGEPLARLHSIDALVEDAQRRLGVPVTWASVHHPDDASATISFGGDHSRKVAWNLQQVFYDAADGHFLHQTGEPGGGYTTYSYLGGMHMAQFGGTSLRWLYFLMGIAGCVMIASGMQVWVSKRARRVAEAGALSGYGLVQGLNVGVVAGMPLACVSMLLANRLLPAGLADRAEAEVAVFCITWILAAAWGAWRDRRGHGWRDLFAATAAALAALPVVNALATPDSQLLATLSRGEYALAAVDLGALAFAIAYAALAYRQKRRQPASASRAPARARAQAAEAS
ncbi:PepSY-associated TM helix domain-containing protein [Marilutibacter chinensis]|uniref:PepSY domain-containing protein n=1 Tax=Marilutibacter chinensis TaxID=2912247 RepID=A0ABS9HQ01_9GAMM|nr:PepSY-associated TM helix domain-containing protein [Lysobacter chinensis]MCF7220693.1 PepSY domain-containing protein [Lysobacter chinensis]